MAEGVEMGVPMRALLAGARRKETELVVRVRRLVEAESPSDDKAEWMPVLRWRRRSAGR